MPGNSQPSTVTHHAAVVAAGGAEAVGVGVRAATVARGGVKTSYSHDFLLPRPGNLGGGFADVEVDFAAHAEGAAVGQIDTRLDGEGGAGQDFALVVGLEVVHVGAGGVDVAAEGVAGAVDEKGAEAGALDHRAHRLIHLEALQGAA